MMPAGEMQQAGWGGSCPKGKMLSLWLCIPTQALPRSSGSRMTWRWQSSICEDEGDKASPHP